MSRNCVVTGANKGIGLAIVKGLLDAGCFVLLGSRDAARGEEAVAQLVEAQPSFAGKVQVLVLDVSDPASVAAAAATAKAKCGTLYALVNNAGGGATNTFMGPAKLADVKFTVDLNLHSVHSVTSAFLPLLHPSEGRIVMVSSGSGPSFVQKCSAAKQAILADPTISWDRIMAESSEFISVAEKAGDPADLSEAKPLYEAAGYGGGGAYGFAKAALTSYAMHLARENPGLKVNSCSPGWVDTDLTGAFAKSAGKTPAEMGMISTEKGASCPLFLALGEVHTPSGSAWFWGSDSLRSPVDKYRSPGDPAYTGGESGASTATLG